mmetsp:Transcript_96540/g.186158  ORF Transcript_96540/g.186158 Transcript_96540/m.186158 type:complete len:187 (+) Transcript_96540:189-749(+)
MKRCRATSRTPRGLQRRSPLAATRRSRATFKDLLRPAETISFGRNKKIEGDLKDLPRSAQEIDCRRSDLEDLPQSAKTIYVQWNEKIEATWKTPCGPQGASTVTTTKKIEGNLKDLPRSAKYTYFHGNAKIEGDLKDPPADCRAIRLSQPRKDRVSTVWIWWCKNLLLCFYGHGAQEPWVSNPSRY